MITEFSKTNGLKHNSIVATILYIMIYDFMSVEIITFVHNY